MQSRDEQLIENTWDLQSLYLSDADWEKEFTVVDEESKSGWPSVQSFKDTLHKSSKTLKDCFDLINSWERKIEKIFVYAHCNNDVDMHQSTYQGFYQRAQLLSTSFQQARGWLEPEILALDAALFNQYVQDGVLQEYAFVLEKIYRKKPHTLSSKEEVLLAQVSWPLSSFYSTFNALNHADASFELVKDQQGEEHALSHGSYAKLLRNQDRTLRENAFRTYHQFYKLHEHTYCENLLGQIRTHVVESNIRNYASPLEASLDRHNIDSVVYETLLLETEKALGFIMIILQ